MLLLLLNLSPSHYTTDYIQKIQQLLSSHNSYAARIQYANGENERWDGIDEEQERGSKSKRLGERIGLV